MEDSVPDPSPVSLYPALERDADSEIFLLTLSYGAVFLSQALSQGPFLSHRWELIGQSLALPLQKRESWQASCVPAG